MSVTNKQLAYAFGEFANLLEQEGDNPYRVRAYRRAARAILRLSKEIAQMIIEGEKLTDIRHIGKGIASHILEMYKTNEFSSLHRLASHSPKYISELRDITGIGPKRFAVLTNELNIASKFELVKAIEEGRLSEHPAFGAKISNQILAAINQCKATKKELRLFQSIPSIESILYKLRSMSEVIFAECCGAYRRRKEVIDQVEMIVCCTNATVVIHSFVSFRELYGIHSVEDDRVSARLRIGIEITLRIIPNDCFGAVLVYYTGSQEHIEQLQLLLSKNDLIFNDRGLQRYNRVISCKDESELYSKIHCLVIPPELRENRGEIAAGQSNQLPKLIELKDIKGDLHCHTFETDGSESLEAMVQAAAERGYEYVAITDHSQHLAITNGLDVKRLLKQIKQIDKLNEKLLGITILKSIEVDILEDGSLDLPNAVLKELDLTVCSIHSKFRIPEQLQTERILRAMDNPYFTILGHATGRLINKRIPYEINLEKIFKAAKERNCIIELNAQPYRLDIHDKYCQWAKQLGLKLAISSDAHSTREYDYMQFGIYQARRGWLEAGDVINTRHLPDFKKLIRRK